MTWITLNKEEQLQEIVEKSAIRPQAIFKHSTRCSISSMAKSRLERAESPLNIDFYYLDLIAFRSISNKIIDVFKVAHESPQLLLIKDAVCKYDESHSGINMKEIIEQGIAI